MNYGHTRAAVHLPMELKSKRCGRSSGFDVMQVAYNFVNKVTLWNRIRDMGYSRWNQLKAQIIMECTIRHYGNKTEIIHFGRRSIEYN